MSARAPHRPDGRLDLHLERIDGRTRPRRAQVQPPLQLSRVRYDADQPDRAVFTLIHLGGILAGDRYQLAVRLGPGASAQIGTAAATQIYCHPQHNPQPDATLELAIDVAAESCLAWLPEPSILFAGARFSQSVRIMLARGARLALLDVSAPGRLARGEVLQFTRYATRLEISDSDGRCLVAERAVLEPQRRALALPGLLDNTPVWGSLYLLDVDLPAEQVCAEIHELQLPLLAASPLPHECGVVVRALGDTPQAVRGALLQVWRMFSPHWRVETAAPAADLQECATLTTGSVSREEESYEHL